MMPLAGKTALVTGASRGIGRATARKLAGAGCDLVLNYHNSHAAAETLAEEIRGLGRRAVAVQANVASPEAVEELFAAVGAEFPAIDIVISNAASGVLRSTLEMTLKHWRWCLETNALALPMLARHAVSRMTRGGRMIAVSSLGAGRALPDYGFVGASKAALESLVRALAEELGARGITVNTVSAGIVDTDALRFFRERETMLAQFAARAPLGRVLVPEDVADAIYLLCLPESGMITGQTLVVDGGYSIHG